MLSTTLRAGAAAALLALATATAVADDLHLSVLETDTMVLPRKSALVGIKIDPHV